MNAREALPTARQAAGRAAAAAGVTICELHEPAQLDQACTLLDRVWRPGAGRPLMTPELLRVFVHSGSYVVGAYEEGRLVGVCIGFLASSGLHSHIAAVHGIRTARHVGFALKQHQRAWSLERGIETVTWTYDPLVSRNGYFNLAKLGAVPTEYLTDFYGPMQDSINAGTPSDRLYVRWELTSTRAVRAGAGEPHPADLTALAAEAVVGLDAKPDGWPVIGRDEGAAVLVRVPADIEDLRRRDPSGGRAWRHAVREVLGGLMHRGLTVTGFAREGWYVLERTGTEEGRR
ncbi:GNAT family N-acetyltransferase [Streptomyces sp. NPDC054864]